MQLRENILNILIKLYLVMVDILLPILLALLKLNLRFVIRYQILVLGLLNLTQPEVKHQQLLGEGYPVEGIYSSLS